MTWLEGADILLHDAQYTKEEYPTRRGWGHSSIDDAGLFASITSAKHTLFAHHDPSHSDAFLERNACFVQINFRCIRSIGNGRF